MKRLLYGLAAFALVGGGGLVVSRTLGSKADDLQRPGMPDNLLPPCPGTPNCVRAVRVYTAEPDAVYRAARAAAQTLAPVLMEEPAPGRLHVVCRAGVFRDDLDVAVEAHAAGAVLHLRSASRVGQSDLGVNRRRAERFLARLEQTLDA